MSALVLTRRQPPVLYPGAGNKQIIQLYKSHLYRELMLRLTGAPTVTGVNNTVANTARGDEWGCVKKVEIIANSADTLFSMSGDQLWFFNRQQTGNNPRITPALGDGATANPAFDSTLMIPFWSYRAGKPMDTALDSGAFMDFRLEVSFGNYTDVNSAATGWTTQPSIEVGSHECENNGFNPGLFRRTVTNQYVLTAAQSAARLQLDVGPQYRGFLINATTPAGIDTPGLITNVKLVSGSTTFFDMSERMLMQWGGLRSDTPFNVEKTVAGIGSISNPRISSASNAESWYNLDICTDGYLSEAIDTANFNEFYLEVVTSAAANINVISYQMLPSALIRKRAAA